MSTLFLLNAEVRFAQERLAVLTPRDRQGLAGRIGVVQTDGNVVSKPTVYFPADGNKPELRLFRVDPRQLELVNNPPVSQSADTAPRLDDPSPAPDGTPAADGGDNLSQSDLDNFFD
ncbi:hypothetical protein [Rhodoferax saidenbachensis]|uniref:Uncharacterized protein n=1 Tax=Rhodoferax saidenbachensis TaxID=1484693 RepID=A0A1P8KBH3_9BURK|nr:hypothetical protein [Rhodoferax saidenbachensis]APW43358.1 hypothetical protein RS694_13010 [Rhodoferax saidenbachensis]